MKSKALVLIVSSLVLSGCAFSDKAYTSTKPNNNPSITDTSSITDEFVESDYAPLPSYYYSSNYPNYKDFYCDVAHSLDDLNYLVSAAVTRHLQSVTINCDFYHDLYVGDFIDYYLDNNHLVNINCNRSQMYGNDNYLSSYTFSFSYLPNPSYTTTASGNNNISATNLNYMVRKQLKTDSLSNLPIDYRPSIEVYDSEGLWWAVQNGLSPSCCNTYTSNLYEKAKDLVRTLVSPNDDAYKIARNIYEYIVNECPYDYDCLSDVSYANYLNTSYALEGVLNKKKAVCDGFSKAYVLLTGIAGVHSVRAYGFPYGSNIGHAWNYVYLNNTYYLVCSTWGRTVAYVQGRKKNYEFISYDAFGTTSNYFSLRGSNFLQLNTSITANSYLEVSPLENDPISRKANYKIDSAVELVNVLSAANSYGLNGGYLNLESGNIVISKQIVQSALSTLGLRNMEVYEFSGVTAYNSQYHTYYFNNKTV